MTTVILVGWAVLAVVMTGLWGRQLRTRNATSVDVAWAGGLAFLALLYPWFSEGDPARRALVSVMGAAWALRLSGHLLLNRVLGHPEEDGRYRALRAHWGTRAGWGFFFVYQAQAATAVVFSLPLAAAMQGGSLGPLALGGAGLWCLAVGGEWVDDRQLARFRADPSNRGKVCRLGLWKYSRHPNYFFEWLHWWAYVLVGEGRALTWLGPLVMWVLLFRVSGIPYTEMQALRSRGEAYREYQRTTSVFFPWFPRGIG